MDAPLMSISWRRGQDTPAPAGPAPALLAERLAAFWQLDAARSFSAPATRLYCYWLQRLMAAGWPTQGLTEREALVAARLGLTVPVVRRARLALVGRGLLTYAPGSDGAAPGWALPAQPAGEGPQPQLTISLPTLPTTES